MTVAAVNGLDVLNLEISRAKFGRAVLEVSLADSLQDTSLSRDARVNVDLAGTANVFTGRVLTIGRTGGTTRLRALEASELDKPVQARYYQNTDANLIAADILRDVGLSAGEIKLNTALERYVRRATTGITALNDLCRTVGGRWRTKPTPGGIAGGTVIAQLLEPNTRANPIVWGEDLLKFDPEIFEFTCLVRAGLMPGMIVRADPYGEGFDMTIESLKHSVMGGATRTCLYGSVIL